ncbi:PH domain-containing protein [Pseudomarimonas salicorniae]|uniref:PH domain-containing protein n=1 Tax=Pseudomarimonas salicorniae TaxID=2933270 RepID=A0ABT0GEH4_9GAMM|nr:PH domain-containing protein [Lysobacter sp. CAU 1642]MCK7592410.1 PH domain-containing protein [Lysobacter sp. CAU 1642]
MSAESNELDSFEALHPRAILGMRMTACLVGMGFGLVPVLALWIVLRANEWVPDERWMLGLLALAVGALAVMLGWRYAALRFARTRYRLDARGLEIRRGVWWRSRIRVLRSRVQHTDVHQGPLDRRWGLADLTVFTAGTESAAIRLAGLPAERALALRDALLQGHDRQL